MTSRWFPTFVGLMFLVLTLFLWQASAKNEKKHVQRRINQTTESIGNTVKNQLRPTILALNRMANRWAERKGIPKDQWQQEARLYIKDQPVFQAIEWVDPTFHIRWIEPLKGNEQAKDLNLAFEDWRQVALERARDSKTISVTQMVDLVQGGKGFLVYCPIHSQDSFMGFILGIYKVDEIFKEILGEKYISDFSFSLYDGDDAYQNWDAKKHSQEWKAETRISLYGTNWILRTYPTDSFLKDIHSPIPWVVLIGGLFVSGFLYGILTLNHRNRINTLKLKELNDALIKSEERLNLGLNSGKVGTWNWDVRAMKSSKF